MWHKVKKLDTKTIHSMCRGEIAQLQVELECSRRNLIVSRPNLQVRYDLLIDDGEKISKVQIKYLNRKAGANCLELKIEDKRYKNKKVYTSDQIDLLLIYVPKIDKILCLKKEDFHNKKTIRINLNNPKAPTYFEKYLW